MFKSYIRVALRNLIKNKLYSAINIFGLSVGLAACILITLFVRDEFNFDTFWSKADSLYRVNSTFQIPGRDTINSANTSGMLRAALESYYPEDVARATRFRNSRPLIEKNGEVFTDSVTWTDADTAEMFSFDMIKGDMQTTLADNASIAINESFANKYFGTDDPMGEVLTLRFFGVERDYYITGLFKDLSHNSVLNIQAIVLIDEKDFASNTWMLEQWFSINVYTYFELKGGGNIDAMNATMQDFVINNVDDPSDIISGVTADELLQLSTTPLVDIQLNGIEGSEMKPTGSMTVVMIFITIAILILLIAVINFMNLATAKSTQRAREVALRKVLGAKRKQLIVQFLGESVLVAIVALLIGLVLIELTLPFYNDYLGRELAFSLIDGITGAILVGLIVIVGVLGGIYPALVLSGYLPAHVLKANKSAESTGSAKFRNNLVVLQFAISIALIIATATVYGQMIYMTTLDPGFKKDNMLLVHNIGRGGVEEQREVLKNAILRVENVTNASMVASPPTGGNDSNSIVQNVEKPELGRIAIGRQQVDHDFFKTYEIPFLAGRDYDRNRSTDGIPSSEGAVEGDILSGSIIVNETALRRLEIASPEEALGKYLRIGIGGDAEADLEIIGVVPDMLYQSLREAARPEMYALDGSFYGTMTISYTGDAQALVREVETIWKEVLPDVPFFFQFLDDNIDAAFDNEKSLAGMLGTFSLLAIIIANLGLFGLASFTAERRTKEIGIRKVMGAKISDIVMLLLWQFSKPVLIANILAVPLTIWAMVSWLDSFPNKMDIWLLVPLSIVAGLIALLVAWATVGGNAAKVARTNPIKALRYE